VSNKTRYQTGFHHVFAIVIEVLFPLVHNQFYYIKEEIGA